MMKEPPWAPLLQLSVEVGDVVTLGVADGGERRMVPILGGTFEGADGWRGRVLAGGADWQRLRGDGVLEVDARYLLEDTAGRRVEVTSRGLRHGPPEVMAALARGEAVDPASYYFRTALRFETADPALQALGRVIAVGLGEREARRVRLSVFALR